MPGSGEPQDAASMREPERGARHIREKGVSVSGLKGAGQGRPAPDCPIAHNG